VEVAAEDVAGVGGGDMLGLVGEADVCVERVGMDLIGNTEVPVGWRIAGGAVVVASYEEDVEAREGSSPVGDGGHDGGLAAAAGVEQVAEDDQAGGAERGDERGEAGEVGVGGALGDGDADGAEGGRFAQVSVGDDERVTAGPEEGALREAEEVFIGPAEGRRRGE